MASKPYNGHPSWNVWNVALWINNDEALYLLALKCARDSKSKGDAARRFTREVGTARTPDGARWSVNSVRLALEELE